MVVVVVVVTSGLAVLCPTKKPFGGKCSRFLQAGGPSDYQTHTMSKNRGKIKNNKLGSSTVPHSSVTMGANYTCFHKLPELSLAFPAFVW